LPQETATLPSINLAVYQSLSPTVAQSISQTFEDCRTARLPD
jgi:hypothetical protein